jgi:hypothetical protein
LCVGTLIAGGSAREPIYTPEKLGSCRLLYVFGGIYIFKGFQQGFDRWQELGAVREVKGTWFEIVPERRTQIACGIAHSRCHHRLRTDSFIGSGLVPISDTVQGEEGSNGKLLFFTLEAAKEEIIGEAGFSAKADPPSPSSVLPFESLLLF